MEISLDESAKDILFIFQVGANAAEKQEFQANTNDFNIHTHELRRQASTVDDKELYCYWMMWTSNFLISKV